MLTSSLQLRLVHQPEGLYEILSRTSSGTLQLQPQPGKWSIHEHIAHLCCYQLEFMNRIRLILAIQEPVLPRYRAEEDERFASAVTLSTDVLLEELKKDRLKINALVAALTGAEIQRAGVHPVTGSMPVLEWIEFFLLHEAHHMLAIFQLAHTLPAGSSQASTP